jgi:hypothetical protein
MRVGISVLTREGQSIWQNGLGQNVWFLADLMRRLSFVEEVILLDSGDQAKLPAEVDHGSQPLRLMRAREATQLLDVVIEMSGGLDVEWLDYMRARGAKVVFHCCGQPYVAMIEPVVFGKPGYAVRADRCDEIWILPKDQRFASMLEVLHRCPVRQTPYLWSPEFIDRRASALLAQHGLQFGYRPAAPGTLRDPLSVAIFEPNISVVKCCTIPMLAADVAYRVDPEAIAAMHVLNSVQMTNHPTFNYLCNSLDLVKDGRATFESRHDFPGYMAQFANAVVSHQWNNDQNNLYLDALYGGYPLIHNSPWLGEQAGYYYPDSDVTLAADRLVWAAYHHHEHLEDYRARAQRFLAPLAPHSQSSLTAYGRRLLELTGRRAQVAR